jgi:hypothetical protein
VAGQFHPEFRSRPTRPHPLFRDFVGAATAFADDRDRTAAAPGILTDGVPAHRNGGDPAPAPTSGQAPYQAPTPTEDPARAQFPTQAPTRAQPSAPAPA